MKNLVLIGMPGTGKSVVGRALADRLGYTFVDVDDLIMEAAGKTSREPSDRCTNSGSVSVWAESERPNPVAIVRSKKRRECFIQK